MRVINRILPISIALFSVAIYLYTAAPFMLWEDAPRFLAAIITLGIARPVDPVYVFLAHWFTYLPFGSVVFRVQFFSALLAGGSLLLLYRLVIRILKIPIPLHLTKKQLKKIRKSSYQHPELSIQRFTLPNEYTIMLAGIFSMSVLAFSYQFWSQAQNVNNPSIGWSTGFTGSPTIILSSVWHYLVIAWMDFTPFLLPFIILGAAY